MSDQPVSPSPVVADADASRSAVPLRPLKSTPAGAPPPGGPDHATPARRGAETQRTGQTLPADEALRQLDSLHERGQMWPAVLGYRDLIRQLDTFETLSPAEQALSLAALRRDVEVGLETRPVEDVVADFTQSLTAWFHKEHWRQRRHQVVAYYRWLIETELRVGHRTEALELFHRARKLLSLEPALEQGLAQAAADLGLTDLGAATLYIKFLQGPDQDGARRRQVLALLRQAIRIDLACPDDQLLSEHRRLNDELWRTREEVWCAGHRAVAAWRSGRPQEACSIREAVVDLTEADADALTQLGLIAYLCRAWDDAVSLLGNARKLRPDHPRAERLYLAMARVNRLLSGGVELPSRDQLLGQLEEQLPVLSAATEDVTAVDARCVHAAACAGLGRDAEALALFARSPAHHLAWRYAVLELAAAERSGQTDSWLTALDQRAAASGEAAVVGPLVRAMLAAERGDWATVRSLAATITLKPPAEPVRDPDPAAVGALLKTELEFTQPEPMAEAPRLAVSEERVSGAVRAWLLRLRARWHTERGEFEPAAALLSQATHGLTPDHVWERAAAAQLALQDADPDAPGGLFEPLAGGPTATPQDRLVWGLWLCGHGDFDRARPVLAELEDVFPQSLELRLARAESELADGGQAAVARQLLQAPVGKATSGDLIFWAKPLRQLSFRPWQRHVPRAFWSWQGQLSPHRIGDMLHGARLLIRAQLLDQALAVVELVEQVLGPEQNLLHPPLAELFRAACLAEMQAGHWEPACELQTRAARCGAPDPQFAVRLAESLPAVEAIPPDAVLAVLHDWIAEQRSREAVVDSPVARVLQRLLHIDARTPTGHAELERCQHWTELLAKAQAEWDWPPRNLARAAGRGGRHEEVLHRIAGIAQPLAEDHVLCGHSAWALGRFDRAAAAFVAALEAGPETPELRGWRGCARTAARFVALQADGAPLTPAELSDLLPDLDWQAADGDAVARLRAWHGAALLAAGQAERAAAVLAVSSADPDLQVWLPILQGVAAIHAGRTRAALELWAQEEGPLAEDLLARALRVLAQWQVGGMDQRAAGQAQVQDLLRRNAADEVTQLAIAHRALAEDRAAAAGEALARAEQSRQLPILLSPLVLLLNAERRFVRARLELRAGRAAEARELFRALEGTLPWPGAVVFWRAVSALESGQRDEAEQLLVAAAAREEVAGDAAALRALLLVRTGRLDAAAPLWEAVRQRAPQHPLALLAQAEAAERQGRPAEAIGTLQELMQGQPATGPRLRATAALTLGRLEWEAGALAAAEKWFRQAVDLRPDWAAAAQRLALFLGLQAQDEPQRQEAARRLDQCLAVSTQPARLHLAAALVADGLGWREVAAEHLRRAAVLADFAALPAETRCAVLGWSVNLHLHLKQFGAAGDALQTLEQEGLPSGDRMVPCWLLEAVQSLRVTPLTPAALERALAAADHARAAAPANGLADLLAALCRLLGRRDDAETPALAARLRAHAFATPEQTLLAAVVRYLAGDQEALAETESLVGTPTGAALDQHLLELLLANQKRQPELLIREAEGLVSQPAVTEHRPWSDDDLTLLRALDLCQKTRDEEALAVLQSWHQTRPGTARTRQVHAQLLARQAIRALEQRDLARARRGLADACGLLEGGARAAAVPPEATGAAPPAAPAAEGEPASGPNDARTPPPGTTPQA